MKTLHPDLEALMPEPVATVDADGFLVVLSGGYIPTHATLFTADQVREAMQAVNERAAKLLESGEPPRKLEGGRVEIGEGARNAHAAAIRGTGGPAHEQ